MLDTIIMFVYTTAIRNTHDRFLPLRKRKTGVGIKIRVLS